MTDQEIIERIDSSLLLEFELSPEQMTLDALLADDLGLDSLDRVDMVVILEKEFGFKISDQSGIREIRTLSEVHDFVIRTRDSKLAEAANADTAE